jgi:chromosome segregation ATPase
MVSQYTYQYHKLTYSVEFKSERPFSAKSNNSSNRGGRGVLSAGSVSVVSLNAHEQNIDTIMAKNKEIKLELHKSRKNNGVLRSKVTKAEKEVNDLRNNKLTMVNKIEKLEKIQVRDANYIKQQEKEIQHLNDLLKGHTGSESSSDPEKEQLRNALSQVIEVKVKYENIIKALVADPEAKPHIARILEK